MQTIKGKNPAPTGKVYATVLVPPGDTAEQRVIKAVQDAEAVCDGFILIDTNPDPEAKARPLRDLVDTRKPVWVKRYVWENHFGAARNAALGLAWELGAEWALTLDPDEDLSGLPTVANFRLMLGANPEVERAHTILVYAADGTYAKERYIRADKIPLPKWVGRTHESLAANTPFCIIPLEAGHFDEDPMSPDKQDLKIKRDIEWLELEIQEKQATHRTWRYLGESLMGRSEWKPARAAFLQATKTEPYPTGEALAWCLVRAAECSIRENDLKSATEYTVAALAADVRFLHDCSSLFAAIAIEEEEGRQALGWAQVGLSTKVPATRVGSRLRDVRERAQQIVQAFLNQAQKKELASSGNSAKVEA